jgi:hypothetical protein
VRYIDEGVLSSRALKLQFHQRTHANSSNIGIHLTSNFTARILSTEHINKVQTDKPFMKNVFAREMLLITLHHEPILEADW